MLFSVQLNICVNVIVTENKVLKYCFLTGSKCTENVFSFSCVNMRNDIEQKKKQFP